MKFWEGLKVESASSVAKTSSITKHFHTRDKRCAHTHTDRTSDITLTHDIHIFCLSLPSSHPEDDISKSNNPTPSPPSSPPPPNLHNQTPAAPLLYPLPAHPPLGPATLRPIHSLPDHLKITPPRIPQIPTICASGPNAGPVTKTGGAEHERLLEHCVQDARRPIAARAVPAADARGRGGG